MENIHLSHIAIQNLCWLQHRLQEPRVLSQSTVESLPARVRWVVCLPLTLLTLHTGRATLFRRLSSHKSMAALSQPVSTATFQHTLGLSLPFLFHYVATTSSSCESQEQASKELCVCNVIFIIMGVRGIQSYLLRARFGATLAANCAPPTARGV